MERGRKNRTNIKKSVIRNVATEDHTIQRRILLTFGSGVLSTSAGDDWTTGVADGVVCAGVDEALAPRRSLSAWLSKSKPPSVENDVRYFRRYTSTSIAECKLYSSPNNRDYSLRSKANYLLKHEERRPCKKQYNVVGGDIYTLFRNSLARIFPERLSLIINGGKS